MEAKVIIENGETEIILTPENEFEKDIVEKVYLVKDKFNIHTRFDAEYNFGSYRYHNIKLSIVKIK